MTSASSEAPDHEANIRSADQRATALAATATITSTLALAGAAIIVDTGKLTQPTWVRPWFSWALFLAVLAFTMAAVIAIHGHHSQLDPCVGSEHPLHPSNLSRSKHNHVTGSMSCLLAGMAFVLLVAFISIFATGAT